jgi:hypothetical protein
MKNTDVDQHEFDNTAVKFVILTALGKSRSRCLNCNIAYATTVVYSSNSIVICCRRSKASILEYELVVGWATRVAVFGVNPLVVLL